MDRPTEYRIPAPTDPALRAEWERAVAERIAQGRGLLVGDR